MKKFFTLKRSFGLFFIMLAVLSALMFGTLQLLSSAEREIERADDSRYHSLLLADEVKQSSASLTAMVRSYVIDGDPKYETKYWDIVDIGNGKKPRPDGRSIARVELMKQAGFTDQEFAKLNEAQSLSMALVKTEEIAMNAVKGQYDDGTGKFTKKDTPNIEMARKLVNDAAYENEVKKIMSPVDDFVNMMDARTKNALETARANASTAHLSAIVMLALMLAISVATLYTLFVLIRNQLENGLQAAERLATGDLTVKLDVERDDEIGRLMAAINGIGQGLEGVVSNVRSGTEIINVASREIATGNADLSNRTESQASSLEETASSMEELTSTVKQNAENARRANQLATSASTLAVKGGEVVGNVVQTMSSIKESSNKVVDIISVIDGIAFQTNILALNAAVEAARAGEQGRGFAVVASEVRSLAQRSASAAKEIKTLISDSVDKVDIGEKLVDEAGVTMGEIVTSIKHVADIMREITTASQEQSVGIEEVNQAITQIDEITQQNAALVEQAAAAAESLQEQVDFLAQAVSVFKTDKTATYTPSPAVALKPRVVHSAPKTASTLKKAAPLKKLLPVAKPVLETASASAVGASRRQSSSWEEF